MSLLQFAAWPTAVGIIIALLAMLVFPQLRGQATVPVTTALAPVSYADAVSRAAPSVVNIYTQKKVITRDPRYLNNPYYRHFLNNSNFPVPLQERMQNTLGSGVIVDATGLILTNYHVINGADKIQVLLYDGRETSAELVGVDNENDLAVLHINLPNLSPIAIGQSSNVRVGDVALAIGNPYGVGQSVSQGIVSAIERWNLGILDVNTSENFIQTDAAINPGNSGGALIDAYGNLIGINTAMLDETGTASVGISFAVPSETAMNSLRQIALYGEIRRGWLGLSARTLDERQTRLFGTSGLIVTDVDAKGPAARAGIQLGDVITQINNAPLTDGHKVITLIKNIQPGAEVTLKLLRDDKTLEIKAKAELPLNPNTKT